MTAAPVELRFEGTLNASGELEKDVAVPPSLFVSHESVFGQGLFFDAASNAFLGSGSAHVAYLP